jgi:hypothetical protein
MAIKSSLEDLRIAKARIKSPLIRQIASRLAQLREEKP